MKEEIITKLSEALAARQRAAEALRMADEEIDRLNATAYAYGPHKGRRISVTPHGLKTLLHPDEVSGRENTVERDVTAEDSVPPHHTAFRETAFLSGPVERIAAELGSYNARHSFPFSEARFVRIFQDMSGSVGRINTNCDFVFYSSEDLFKKLKEL